MIKWSSLKLFIKLFKAKLVYKKEAWTNWDPKEKTVLANEQVIDGKGWRSGVDVEKKLLNQWFLSITKFADQLLYDLDKLTNWPENVINMQKNWIGKSKGVEIKFTTDTNKEIKAFTTRPDTLFGVTFFGISPNHPIVNEISKNDEGLIEFLEVKTVGGWN